MVAIEATGGVFRAGALGPPAPQRTAMPAGLRRLEQAGDTLLACHPEAAQRSTDAGRTWHPVDFGCGADGRRTAVFLPHTLLRLEDQQLVIRARAEDADIARVALPLAQPRVVSATEQSVVVFGRSGVAWSGDGGRSFQLGRRDDLGQVQVRDVVFVGKGLAIAVGQGAAGGSSVLRSVDAGRSWAMVPELPRRAEDLWAVDVAADGTLAAVSGDRATAIFGTTDGLRWWADPDVRVAHHAVAAWPTGGFIFGAPRGVFAMDGAGPPAVGLDRPLRTVVATHPRVLVGVGLHGGLFRSLNGGLGWGRLAHSHAYDLTDVCRVDQHRLVLVGGGILWTSDDAGGTWTPERTPHSCAARWVRFAPTGAGVVACQDAPSLRSGDGGETWHASVPLPDDLAAPVWLKAEHAVARAADGRRLWQTLDGGQSWQVHGFNLATLGSIALDGDGLTVATLAGDVWMGPAAAGPWHALRSGPVGFEVRAHQRLADGRMLLLGPDGLWAASGASRPQRLAHTPQAFGFVLPNDGSALVLQRHATTRLEPR